MKSIICLLLGVSCIVFGDDEYGDDGGYSDEYGQYTESGELIITEITGKYKMGNMITCFEQNDENWAGYKDKIYSDEPDKETGEVSDMCTNEATKIFCDRYKDEAYPEPGKGDVCDHTDPRTGVTRNACYFNTIYGAEINEEKTWSYKCWEISQCPLKDENGVGIAGCQVTHRRINCCCQEDYCNGGEGSLIQEFAAFGRPDHYGLYGPDLDAICAIDFSKYDWYVKFIIPAWSDEKNEACSYDPKNPGDGYSEPEEEEEGDDYSEPEEEKEEAGDDYSEPEEEEEEGNDYSEPESPETPEYPELTDAPADYDELDTPEAQYTAAQAAFTEQLAEQASKQSEEMINMADIVLIFSYFIIGIVCLGIGVFIGTKWKTSVMQQQMMIKDQQLDI
eukprot:CAMPEP_0201564100 /NCGR_PEP_ID=MMETSP0190_2-20130828/2037_1 /ASSEMBLY_ACC=CAM_ASM_000263 /TAXON_ID=37353 /ORGANISM="Rosalina sp." /LENGTH=391 /DNA_ID=CAMNT_0047979791 /DNA_START=136 /DNA_END=1311 /DNA_ORIENTATION=+